MEHTIEYCNYFIHQLLNKYVGSVTLRNLSILESLDLNIVCLDTLFNFQVSFIENTF